MFFTVKDRKQNVPIRSASISKWVNAIIIGCWVAAGWAQAVSKTVIEMGRGQLELKAMTTSVDLKDKYTEMLLTAGRSGREKSQIVLNLIKWLEK